MNYGLEMQVVDGCLMAPVPDILDDDILKGFNRVILNQVSSQSLRHVLLDVSARNIIDSTGFMAIVNCAKKLNLLGAKVVFVGFQPGVVSALIDLDVCLDDITCVGTLEDGCALFHGTDTQEEEEAPEEEQIAAAISEDPTEDAELS